MIKKRQEAGIIQRYHPNWTSRLKLELFRTKSQEQVKSALYRMGRNEKSIFWYWEIDYKLGHYRTFFTIDLAKGERRFEDEDFASWPELMSQNDEVLSRIN